MHNLTFGGRNIGKNWLTELATTTRYSLDDLTKAFYVIQDKDKFLQYVDEATKLMQSSVYSYISARISIGSIPIPKHIRV